MEDPFAARISLSNTAGGRLLRTFPVELGAAPASGGVFVFGVSSFELQPEPTRTATSVRTINVATMRLVVQRFFIWFVFLLAILISFFQI
jgi:hypothetical protein